MGLLELCLIIILIGVVLWAVNAFIPMDANVKKILNVVVVVVLVVWLLSIFIGHGPDIPIHRLRVD